MTAVQEIQGILSDMKLSNSVQTYTNLLGEEIAEEGFIMNTLHALWELIKRALNAIQRFWYVTIRKDPDELIRNFRLDPTYRRAFDETQKVLKEVRGMPWDNPEWEKASKKIHDIWNNTRDEMQLQLAQYSNDRFYKKLPNDGMIRQMIDELQTLGEDCKSHGGDSVSSVRQQTALNLISAHGVAMQCRDMTVFKKRDQFLGNATVSDVTANYI